MVPAYNEAASIADTVRSIQAQRVTIREILVCGCVAGLALGAVGLGISRKHDSASKPNPVIQGAMHDETKSVLASVTRIAGLKQG